MTSSKLLVRTPRFQVRSLRNLSREKTDTLLLILACFLAISNHFSSAPVWVIGSSITVMIWRTWLTMTGRELPAKLILIPVAMLLMGGIFLHFRSFFGREAGVSMLLILIACKMLEMHAKRDLFVIVFLALFLILTSFFDSQSLVSAMQVSLSAIAILLAQISYQFAARTTSIWQRLRIIFKMIGLAIPLTVICFFLFPRIQGPLWGLPSDANIARSGLSDSMSPGNISKLAMSEELVFRVKFLDGAPEKSQLYWRAITLDDFDGRTWTASNKGKDSRPIESTQVRVGGKAIRQEITLEPSGNYTLFGLDLTVKAPEVLGGTAYLNRNAELLSSFPLQNRLRYQVISYPQYLFGTEADSSALRQALTLPRRFNPQTAAFAEQIKRQFSTPKERITALLSHFRNESFFYTLEPPPLGRNTIDDFLFRTRAGFCEHYASSFAIVMRYLDIPSRIVTGYQGGSLNTQDGYYEVRQSDAHAWVEVWLDQSGWVRIDPTAAVAPDRILKNLNATQQNSGINGLVNQMMGANGFINEIRMRWSALNNTWNQWVLNYNENKQNDILRSLGLKDVDWQKGLINLFLIGLAILGLMAMPLLKRRAKPVPIDELYSRFCKTLSKKGLIKANSEGPHDFLARLRTQLSQEDYLIAKEIIHYYIDQKYGKQSDARRLNDIMQRLKQLK